MRKIRLFGLILMVMPLVIIALISCSNPVFPDGSYTTVDRQDVWRIPGNTVIDQLEWLQDNAQANGNYVVVARLNEPRIPGNNPFGISYGLRENITVTITTIEGLPRQTLRLLGSGVMLDVGPTNTLILQNINLQISDTPQQTDPIVSVYNGTLQMTNSAISGNYGGRGVLLTAGGTLNMGNGAVIYGNSGGVFAESGVLAKKESRVYMYGNATIRNNRIHINYLRPFGAGVSLKNSTLIMRDSAAVNYNYTLSGSGGGISAEGDQISGLGAHVYMFDSAMVHGNSALSAGGIHMWSDSNLNIHGNNVRISANRAHSAPGGFGWNGGGVSFMGAVRFQISGGTIYGIDAPAPLRNMALLGSAFQRWGTLVRVGSYCSEGGFEPCGFTDFTLVWVENTFRVIDGVLQ